MLHVFTPCNISGVESVSYLKYKTIKSKAVLETVVKDVSLYSFNSVAVHYTNTSAKNYRTNSYTIDAGYPVSYSETMPLLRNSPTHQSITQSSINTSERVR